MPSLLVISFFYLSLFSFDKKYVLDFFVTKLKNLEEEETVYV